ncbi:hypothetical protein [Latilactobacillus fuchuensis]|uniref:Uncharacterized protein n=1 Tax=Latilactobacillus fuchuensis DSM 14340 = JCM 11249 TaxID=1423747 RepID=A0A0R1S8D7_9LACO|nr:hypothetical protein [Latilactobacillus fuchuensis]KRL61771.1 hypothetical protein FC69_GL001996 [Latilactobacillus fuchuensis DSM 14340 = JCM 11249]
MTNDLKEMGKYVTFVPTNKEFPLLLSDAPHFGTTDKQYLKYDVKTKNSYSGTEYYQYTADTPEKLKLFTNAYTLYYQAIYQGIKFGALVDPNSPIITLTCNSEPTIPDFKRVDKFGWEKDVDISEVAIIPVKDPIDLTRYLP